MDDYVFQGYRTFGSEPVAGNSQYSVGYDTYWPTDCGVFVYKGKKAKTFSRNGTWNGWILYNVAYVSYHTSYNNRYNGIRLLYGWGIPHNGIVQWTAYGEVSDVMELRSYVRKLGVNYHA